MNHPEMLSQTSLPVAAAYYSPTVYWLLVMAENPLPEINATRVMVGDYLLVETAAKWTRRRAAIVNRLCTLRVRHTSELILAFVEDDEDYFGQEAAISVNTFGRFSEAELVNSSQGQGSNSSRIKGLGEDRHHQFVSEDVVGVCLHLFRLLDHFPTKGTERKRSRAK